MVMIVVFQLLLILMFGLGTWAFADILRRDLRTGKCHTKRQDITREDQPLLYWFTIVMDIGWVILLPSCFIYAECWFIQLARSGAFAP